MTHTPPYPPCVRLHTPGLSGVCISAAHTSLTTATEQNPNHRVVYLRYTGEKEERESSNAAATRSEA